MPFARRQALNAALILNALQPVPSYYAGIPAMFGGWLTSELAPHLLTLTTLDMLRELVHPPKGGRSGRGLALAAGSMAGLAALIAQSELSKGHVDRALCEGLGDDYRERLSANHSDLDLSTPIRQLAMPFRLDRAGVEVIRDIPYVDHGRRGLLDVYRSHDPDTGPGRGRAPVLLQVHGGGWTLGSKDEQGIPLMLHMAGRGWICVAINYRLSPRDAFPAHLVDVKRAIAWIRENIASYGGDPDFISITGGSAGGHLTALAALTANDPEYQPGFEDVDTTLQAAVPHYGVYDFAEASNTRKARLMRDEFLGPRILKKNPRKEIEAFEKASPLLQVNADAPPFFVIHGHHDTLVEVKQARQFVEALRGISKQPVAYAELPGTQHAFDVFPSIRSAHVVRGVDRFLRFTHDRWQDDRLEMTSSGGTA